MVLKSLSRDKFCPIEDCAAGSVLSEFSKNSPDWHPYVYLIDFTDQMGSQACPFIKFDDCQDIRCQEFEIPG